MKMVRKTVEEDSHQWLAELRAIVDAMPEALTIAEPLRRVVYHNPASLALHGYASLEEATLSGKAAVQEWEFLDMEGLPVPVQDQPLQRALRGEVFTARRLRARRRGHDKGFIGSYSGGQVLDARGRVRFAIVTVRDVTAHEQAEEALRLECDKARAVVDNVEVGIGITDPNGAVLALNPAGLRIHGFASEANMFARLDRYMEEFELCYPDGREMPLEDWPVSRAMRGEYVRDYDVLLARRGNPDARLISYSVVPICDSSGKAVTFVFNMVDLTDRKRAEEKISRQAAIVQAINRIFAEYMTPGTREELGVFCLTIAEQLTQSEFGFIGESGADGLLHDVAISDPGWAACTLRSKTSHRRAPGDFEVHGLYGRVVTSGKSLLANDPSSHPDSIGTPPGHPPVKAFLGVPLEYEGRTSGILALANRVGGYRPEDLETAEALAPAIVEALARKKGEDSLLQAHDELAASEERLKRSQEIAHLGSWELDLLNGKLTWSDEVYRIFGFTPQEFGATYEAFLDAIHPDDRSAVDEAYSSSVAEARDSYDIEHRVVRKSTGEIRYVHEKCQHVRDKNGKIMRSMGMVQDITERKKADDLKDEFLGLISHEMKTPLTVLLGGLHTVIKDGGSLSGADRDQLLADAYLEAESLADIVTNLLEVSRWQAGRLALNTREMDIGNAIRAMVERARQQHARHRFETEMPDRMPPVRADRMRVERILYNLLDNAAKFSPEGSKVRLSAGKKNGQLVIGVKDQGSGISMEDQTRLFSPFERLGLGSEGRTGGTGLGLVVCQKLVEAHEGRIWVESGPGKGAVFYFTLPLAERESQHGRSRQARQPKASGSKPARR